MTSRNSLGAPVGGFGTEVRGSLRVERPHYPQWRLNEKAEYSKPKRNICKEATTKCCGGGVWKTLSSLIPILSWLPKYDFKTLLIGDIVSGVTVAIMHIPQGMGYALLGNLPPIVGIYTAFFPVLIYFLLGTGRHNSMGSFAVICLMVGQIVLKYRSSEYSEVEIAVALCFMCGVYQLAMYFLRLGVVTSLLSETLISGFTTGAAIHVLTSQINGLLGLKGAPEDEPQFQVIHSYIDIFSNVQNLNWTAVIISSITIIILLINNEMIKPRLAKVCKVPVPIELIVVVSGTLASRYGELREKYHIPTVGEIPTGLPEPTVPSADLMGKVAIDAIAIAVVSYAISFSMALIFAQRIGYRVHANQELLAQGVGNVFGSFFGCMPFAASISRSTIQHSVGGQTQLTSLISCSLLVFVLLWIGPFFEPLPKCVLASIIVVALKGMLKQVLEFRKFMRYSYIDAFVWMATFLTVVLVSIDIGLFVGTGLSLMSLIIRGLKPYACLLGNVPNTDLYLDMTRYKGTEHPKGVRVFHYSGGLNFATKQHFRSTLCRMVDCDPSKINCKKNAISDSNSNIESSDWRDLSCIVVDFSAVMYIDPSAAKELKALSKQFSECGISLYLASCPCNVFETIQKCCNADEDCVELFVSVHDAVHAAHRQLKTVSVDIHL